ncbi:MAG: DUF1801 domain-containing protein [Aquabacterium sp.]
MASEPKTKPTDVPVPGFIAAMEPAFRRDEAALLVTMMKKATRADPVMWGPSIVGFGSYTYTYASGRSGDWPLTGFANRGKEMVVYLVDGFDGHEAMLAALGPHRHGASCLYIKKLAQVDLKVLERMVQASVKAVKARHAKA